MCGIAGICNLREPEAIAPELIRRMTAALRHRGPDESGVYLDDRAALGHARLSIIDLAGGAQPIHNEDQSLWIVYNGEVFNYPELRAELLARGHRFTTETDTEVILHLYEERGPACLDALNGQFALAIWDARKHELFLARDRVGIRPLHYVRLGDRLLFASEIKALFADEAVPRRIDPAALDQTFTFWTTLPGRTAFEGIHELPPGHYLLARDGRLDVRRYWDVPFQPPAEQLDWPLEKIIERLRELLDDATRIRLRADVPVGCYLSGGLDSSALSMLVATKFNADVRTFGIRFEDAAFDEGAHQQEMVAFLGTRHTELRAGNAAIAAALPDVVRHAERPLLRTAPVPLFLLSQLVHENNYKVVLTGEGADEVFGGYNIFREAGVRQFCARRPASPFRPALIERLYPYIFDDPRLAKMTRSFFLQGLERAADPLFSHFIRWENTAKIKTFLSPELRAAADPAAALEELRASLPADIGAWEPLARAQYLETKIFLGNYLLSSQGDRMAMAHSLEIRLPYLDYRLLEFMGRVPAWRKLAGLHEKALLKRAFRGALPESIVTRAKHPYRAPIKSALLGGEPPEYVEELLSERRLREAGLFDATKVGRLLRKLRAAESPSEVDNMALAGILTTQLLADQFLARPNIQLDSAGANADNTLVFDKREIFKTER